MLLAAALTGTGKLLVARRMMGQRGFPRLLAVAHVPVVLVGVMLSARGAHRLCVAAALFISSGLVARAFILTRAHRVWRGSVSGRRVVEWWVPRAWAV